MNDREPYQLQISFGIDDGEIDGGSVQDAFVRGFEVGALWGCGRLLSSTCAEVCQLTIHSDNEERVKRFVAAAGCKVIARQWLNDDWVSIQIGPVLDPPTS